MNRASGTYGTITKSLTYIHIIKSSKRRGNNSDRERQTPYDLSYMWNVKRAKHIEKELRLVVARGKAAKWVKVVKRYKLQAIR